MSIEDAREAVERTVASAMGPAAFMEAADAYALAVHVDACRRIAPMCNPPEGAEEVHCGDTWYCETAKRIQELGQ